MRSLLLALIVLTGCSSSRPAVAPVVLSPIDSAAIVAAGDRLPADRALDGGRHPAALLDFVGVKQGMRVADLMAGGGYTTELLARAVGPSGKVYGVNPPFVLQKFGSQPWADRLARPANAQVLRLDRDLDAPLPGDVKALDAVVSNLIYHDTVSLGTDRKAMNAAIFRALKPGGVYVVIDSSARLGSGLEDVKTLHRIEETVVRNEVEAAGFQLDSESPVWRNAEDARDWNASPSAAGERRGTSDRFALRYVRPRS